MYIFICLLTLFIASRADLMYENITCVASIEHYRFLVIAFTIFCAVFFAIKTKHIFQKLQNNKKIYLYIIYITGLTMSIGAFFPYTTNGQDLLSKIHVYCSMLSCLSFLTLLFIYTRIISFEKPDLYFKIHYFYDLGIQFLAILLVVFARVNGYIEILFTIFVSGYLMLIEKNDD